MTTPTCSSHVLTSLSQSQGDEPDPITIRLGSSGLGDFASRNRNSFCSGTLYTTLSTILPGWQGALTKLIRATEKLYADGEQISSGPLTLLGGGTAIDQQPGRTHDASAALTTLSPGPFATMEGRFDLQAVQRGHRRRGLLTDHSLFDGFGSTEETLRDVVIGSVGDMHQTSAAQNQRDHQIEHIEGSLVAQGGETGLVKAFLGQVVHMPVNEEGNVHEDKSADGEHRGKVAVRFETRQFPDAEGPTARMNAERDPRALGGK